MKWIGRTIKFIFFLFVLWALFSLVSHQWETPTTEFSHRLKILTYNTQALCIGDKNKVQQMLTYINEQDADVVCLQEVKVYKNTARITLPELRQAMKDYPYTYYDFKVYNHVRQFGNVVFSRYPLINKKTIRYESKQNISSRCDMVVGDDTIRLIVNHLESYGLMHKDIQLDTLTVNHIKERRLKEKLQNAGQLRHEQAKAVKKEINASPYPAMVVGDFNAIPLSYVYWKIRVGLHDCFLQGSFGQLGCTYKRGPLGIRIDYILCSKDFTPIQCEVKRVDYSDHYPVCATIGW